jgi:serine/threonine protein kinase
MHPERVERVRSLSAAALSRPQSERAAYLDAACAGDIGLRRDVEEYLFSGDKTEQFIFHPNADQPADKITQESPDARITKEFGKYIIDKRIAEGGMGIVYSAIDKQLGREVALKILPEYFSADRGRLQRFHREARATSLLNHPNIVTVFELGQVDGCEYIVTEFVEGETLRQKMERGPIPFVEMLKISSQVAGALGAAHKAGIIHRDIKPENVMIRPDGYVKVLDFGLAKLSDATGKRVSGSSSLSQHNRTIPGMILGTAAYMSPEQAEGTDIDARTDIWGLGVMLYEMAAGKLPFDGPTASHTIVAILEQEPEPFDHPSAELKQIISTALQKDRQLRFQNAEAMAEALDGLKHRLGYISDQRVTDTANSKTVPDLKKPPTIETRKGGSKLIWAVAAVMAVLFVGALGILGLAAFVSWSSASVESNSATPLPSPTAEIESVVATPEPTPVIAVSSPDPIYVEATPLPKPDVTVDDPPARTTSTSSKRPEARPERTPIQARPRPTPVVTKRKPRPKQDPNCVFTNTCH